jgi:uncharacterized protein YndB with AHSA1/START domain
MTKLEFVVPVSAPIGKVYEYTANPNNWTEWYPGTTDVTDAPVSPKVGDAWEETVKVAGMTLRFRWEATAVEAPREWTLSGAAKIRLPLGLSISGGVATLHYKLDEESDQTTLRRDVVFQFDNPILGFANRFLLKRKISVELEAGLQKLKQIIEAL